VECPEQLKFEIAERAVAHFSAKYPVNTIDGVRMTFPKGWGLIRSSNTQPVLVLRFEATAADALAAYQGEVMGWLAEQGVKT
jgi:phosphomannomutase/phosphoglucomutase